MYVGSAVVLIGFALTACGTEVTPTSGASSTPLAGLTSANDAVPTAVPAAPPTQAFLDRARAVERAVLAAGIPEPPAGIFLHS